MQRYLALLDNPSGLRANITLSVGSFFLAGLSDSVVIQQKENLQWCDSMIASILRVWCVESEYSQITMNHTRSNHRQIHVALSGTSGWSTLQSDIILVWKQNAQTGRALLNHPKNLKKYLIMLHFQSLSWTTDWIWHILLWHIGWQKHCVLLQGFIAYNQWFWFQSIHAISANHCIWPSSIHMYLVCFFQTTPRIWYLAVESPLRFYSPASISLPLWKIQQLQAKISQVPMNHAVYCSLIKTCWNLPGKIKE